MSIAYPEIIVTPDTPTIKFRQPREQVDLAKEIPRILHAQGWGCGTYFNVQFLNHERTKLLSCAKFVVVEETETTQINDANPYQPMTKTVFSRSAEQVGDWWSYQEPKTTVQVSWNPEPTKVIERVNVVASGDGGLEIEEPKRRGRPPKITQITSV